MKTRIADVREAVEKKYWDREERSKPMGHD